MFIATVLVFVVTFLIVYHLFAAKKEPGNLPPGPYRWPIVGSLPYLTGDIRKRLKELGDKYGDVFTIYMGSKRTVILNSIESTRDAFVKKGLAFGGRPQDLFFIKEITEGKGVISSEGKTWQEQRRLGHRILKDLGLGNNVMAERIITEIEAFSKELEKHLDRPFDPIHLTTNAIGNLIYSITFGERYDYDDVEFKKYMDIMRESFELCGTSGPLNVFPFLKYLPGDCFGYKKLMANRSYMDNVFHQQLEKRKSTDVTPSNGFTNFTDAYFNEMKKLGEGADTSINYENCLRFAGDLTGAGVETTSNTLLWIFLYLVRHPDVMGRMQRDVDDVIGARTPTMADKANLPFVEAFINEVHRVVSLVPLGVPHAVTEDCEFRGFSIPKGTAVMSIISSIHADERKWSDPRCFRPQRFLDDQNRIINADQIAPFSLGKRICLGEVLAKMEIFLIVTSLLQRFSFHPVEGQPLPSTVGYLSITHTPPRFSMIIKRRKSFH